MSLLQRVKVWLTPRRTLQDRANRAYGLWLAGPQTTSALKFISNMTGIPREDVWGLIYGKKEDDG